MISYGSSNVGKVRINNDDSFYCSDGQRGIYIVADGMGGYRGGKIASQLAVDTVISYASQGEITPEAFPELMSSIQIKMRERIEQDRQLEQMGTTLTAMFTKGSRIDLLHIGDSRAYLISRGEIRQITEDHTLVNFMYTNGEITLWERDHHPKRNILMKVITAQGRLEADHIRFQLEPGEIVLLCSDGLVEHVKDEKILEILTEESTLQAAGDRLIQEALDGGGTDNIAVVLVKDENHG